MIFLPNGGASAKPAGPRRYLNNLVLHFRPTTVPAATLPLTLSWGLGGMAAVLVLVRWGTGGLLNFVYESVQAIHHDVAFGRLVRNLHHWGASLLVLIGFLHLLRVATIPHLVVRELAVAAVLLAGLLVLAVIFGAPLHAPANPGLSPNPTKAPWYFAGLQKLLLHFPPVLAVTVIPFLVGLMLVLMPFLGGS